MMKFDQEIVLSNVYMIKQIRGENLCKLSKKRKKVPYKAQHMWKYNRMHQKDIFSEPLVHGMCTDLHNTYKDEFPQIYLPEEMGLGLDELPEEAGLGLDELPEEAGLGLDELPEEAGLNLNELPQEAGLNLNDLPEEATLGLIELPQEAGLNLNDLPEEAALGLIELPQEAGLNLNELPQETGLNLNELPQEAGLNLNELPQEAGLGLNDIPQEAGLGLNENPQEAGLNLNEIPQEEDALDFDAPEEDALEEEEEGVGPKPELTNEQRFGVYFALEVIKCRDGSIQMHDKELIAVMLNTSVRTIERIWLKALGQIARNEEVDVSNQKKGNVGRKKKDLDLPSVATVPLNQRRTIRGLARSLGVSRSTLHRRFKLGFLRRHSSRLKPSMTLANKLKRLQFCVLMLDEGWLTSPWPMFKLMDNVVHIDEKWFYMTKVKNNYYLLPEESVPLRTVHNKNNIGKVMFLTAVAKPRYGEGGVVTFDGKIGTWAFVQETPAKKKVDADLEGQLN